jgi:pimeloyl-ACP methyl ester carboxylesterase
MPQKDYTWNWMDTTVNYKYIPCENPYTNKDKQAILFIHGFGANCYHWRHNMIQLSQHYDIYSIDLLGFGKSGKPLEMDYTLDLWSSQILEFVETVIEKNTFLVGNSLGGTVSLQAASSSFVNGVVLINPYGKYNLEQGKDIPTFTIPRILILALGKMYFSYFKHPIQIKNTLQYLYPQHPEQVDSDLVESIIQPTREKNVVNVLNNIIENIIYSKQTTIEEQVNNISKKPILAIWGTRDEWIPLKDAYKLKSARSDIVFKFVNGGHCPHDEIPDVVNKEIVRFISQYV